MIGKEHNNHTVRRVKQSDVEQLAVLFDGYRKFYREPSTVGECIPFMERLIETGDSVFFI
jgi:ribosomal protein L44E